MDIEKAKETVKKSESNVKSRIKVSQDKEGENQLKDFLQTWLTWPFRRSYSYTITIIYFIKQTTSNGTEWTLKLKKVRLRQQHKIMTKVNKWLKTCSTEAKVINNH